MEITTFLKSVVPTGGKYCILALKPHPENEGEVIRRQKFFSNVEKAAKSAKNFDDNNYDTYFALASLGEEKSRKARNAIAMGSLFLDLDCGDGKEYPDQHSALIDLRDFVTTLKLPKPLMVSSGYGIHVYWPLSEPAPIDQWRVVAKGLKRACIQQGLKADPVATEDVARVLRVPGTYNHKRGSKAPVEILGTGSFQPRPLTYYADLFDITDLPEKTEGLFGNVPIGIEDDPVMQRLLQSRTSSFRTVLQKSFNGVGCQQIRQAVTDQAGANEPLWRAVLSVANFCEDREKAIHAVSRDHPEYDPEETEQKAALTAGPYTCETFASINPEGCEGCPLKGVIKSPIVLGHDINELEKEEVIDEGGACTVVYKDGTPTLPRGYVLGSGGSIFKRERDDEGNTVNIPIYMNKLYFTSRVLDPEIGECLVGRLHLPHDTPREFTLPLVSATSKEEIRKVLSKNGVAVGAKQWDGIMAYTHAWIEKLQEEDAADTARRQFGWTDENMTSYVIGDREIFGDRIEYNPPSSKTARFFPDLRKRGTLEGWVNQANFYNREGLEPYQFVVCQALAAPLMRLTPVHAAIFDFFSDGSGHGKTTTQEFAATIYGSPSATVLGAGDTLNSRMHRMEIMKDVSVQFDEFTEFPAEHTSELIYSITNGRQKARMESGSNEERIRGEPWSTTVTASSNYSMLSKVYAMKSNPQAEIQRVLRYHVQPHNFTEKNETDVFAKSVGQNCGHAVEVFVQYVINNLDVVKELLEKVQRRIDTACGLTMQNRFWSIQGSVTVTALLIARETGILSYDTQRLMKWVVNLINENKKAALDSTPPIDSIVTEFVTDHFSEVLWIRGDQKPGENENGLDNLVVPEMHPRGKLAARYETDVKMLYIVLRPFKLWCTKRRFNYDSVVKEAIAKFGGGKKKIRISRGTKLNLPPVDVLQLDCSSIDIAEPSNGGSERG